MVESVPPDVVLKALRKMAAALQGLRREPVVIGALANHAWGANAAAQGVELLIAPGEQFREPIFSAARGEGLVQAPDTPIRIQEGRTVLRLRYADAKLNATADIELLEASTMHLKQTAGRAKPGSVLGMPLLLATPDDAILMLAGSANPADRATLVELLRMNAGRIDPAYLKKEAEGLKVFDSLKVAWQEAKRQG